MNKGSAEKAIAYGFLKSRGLVVDGKTMARSVIQAKKLIAKGYTVEDMLLLFDYSNTLEAKLNIYSLGFFLVADTDTLIEKAKVWNIKNNIKSIEPSTKTNTTRNKEKVENKNYFLGIDFKIFDNEGS